ncbi:hypothetical protein THAOC_01029 [Thalassiosira oceanica]|uniref:Kazal-like domain-containing protein n=1 Tax=Thalassiosira oceanica TaxID=159749 RepID=K0TJ82_THAOC|nr:hypothetical protein THAOC_01029 [Thalassiosira oceanica]|eukprot:EJK77159.1 hypothetical protein THAOC_01029 [Thalassiosira oceanica]
MLATTTARIIFIGLSAAAASSVQLVEDGSLPKIGAAGNGDDVDGFPSHLSESNDCGCVLGEGKFCGNDGQCHFYNCEEYYKYGPVTYTGYGPDAPELECRDTAETEADERDSSSWRWAVFSSASLVLCVVHSDEFHTTHFVSPSHVPTH